MSSGSDKRVSGLRIAMVTPHSLSENRGNSITALRIAREMESHGAQVRMWQADRRSDVAVTAEEILAFQPSVINGFHGYHFSRLALYLRRISETPIVVTTTGTDVNVSLYSETSRRITARCLRTASAVVTFCEETAARLESEILLPRARIRVIPQAVDVTPAAADAIPFRRREGDFVLCVPAGLRRVKNPLFCMAPVHSLRTEYPNIVVVFAGPVIESDILDDLTRETANMPWAHYVGELPHDQIPHLMRQSDVVVNSSFSEGMSVSLLEAMSLGIPVLASNIEGNRAVVEDGVDGLLFETETDFMRQLTQLIENESLRRTLAEAATKRIERDHSTEKEAAAYLELWKSLVGA